MLDMCYEDSLYDTETLDDFLVMIGLDKRERISVLSQYQEQGNNYLTWKPKYYREEPPF